MTNFEKLRLMTTNVIRSDNYKNWDLAAKSYAAAAIARPDLAGSLKSRLDEIAAAMMFEDVSAVPPHLVRAKGETTEHYLERCYHAGGYFHA